MIDDGQAVDIRGLSEKTLVKHLRRLFLCLNLKETGDNIFLLKSEGHPTLEVCRPVIHGYGQSSKQQLDHCTLENELLSVSPDGRNGPDANMTKSSEGAIGPRRRYLDILAIYLNYPTFLFIFVSQILQHIQFAAFLVYLNKHAEMVTVLFSLLNQMNIFFELCDVICSVMLTYYAVLLLLSKLFCFELSFSLVCLLWYALKSLKSILSISAK